MEYLILVVATITCAVLAIRATQLLTSALWLAGASMLTALILYLIGAQEVAIIELSVGAGLVTVLFVFAISIAGDDAMKAPSLIPKTLVWLLTILLLLLLGFLARPTGESSTIASTSSFATVFWQERVLDVFAQIVLIFAGVLTIVGLFSEPKSHTISQPTIEDFDSDTDLEHSQFCTEDEIQPEEELV